MAATNTQHKRKRPSAQAVRDAFAEKIGTKKAVTVPHQICLDSHLADQLSEAVREMDMARVVAEADPENTARYDTYMQKRKAVEEMRTRARPFVQMVALRGINPIEWEKLKDEHPADDAVREKLRSEGIREKDMPAWHPQNFPPVAIARCAVIADEDGAMVLDDDDQPIPAWSLDEMKAMFESDQWSTGELLTMFYAVVEANNAHKVADLGKDSSASG